LTLRSANFSYILISLAKKSQACYAQSRSVAEMKTKVLVFFLFLPCFLIKSAYAGNLPEAVLRVGIYYAFEPADTKVFEKNIRDLIGRLETDINNPFSRKIINVKIVLIDYWKIENMPVYKDAAIPYALNVDKIWPMFQKLTKPPADFYFIFFAGAMVSPAYSQNHTAKLLDGIVEDIGKNNIAFANFSNPNPAYQNAVLMLHELGHGLGLKEHADDSICAKKYYVMCGPWQKDKSVIYTDAVLKNALYRFYIKKAKPPRQSAIK